uniref:Ionotropic glutamate receptor C-terminal domain-containing protein n=1 Tax=Strigamia maritima TaxID=126957 RepID=T1J0T5_STRMM
MSIRYNTSCIVVKSNYLINVCCFLNFCYLVSIAIYKQMFVRDIFDSCADYIAMTAFLNEYSIEFRSCDIKDDCCISDLNSICCFLYIVVTCARYFRFHHVAVFLFPDNEVDKQKVAMLLSEQFIGNRIFSVDTTLSIEKLLQTSDTDLFFVRWTRKQNQTNTSELIKLLNNMIKLNLLQPPRILCIVTDDVEEPIILLKGVHLSPLSLVVVIDKNSSYKSEGFSVKEVYGVDENHTLTVRLIGNMMVHGNIVTYNKLEAFPLNIRKLQNYTIKVGALRRPPFTDYYPETNELTGVLGKVLIHTSTLFSLRYITHLSGEDIATKTLDIFEELRSNKSELILGVHTMNTRRIKLFSFSRPVALGQYYITYKRPESVRFVSGYRAAFTIEMWILIVAYFLIFSIILVLTSKITKILSTTKVNSPNQIDRDIYDIKITIFNTFGALLQQGETCFRHSQSGQIIWFTFCLFAFLIFVSFSSKLTSFFTVYTEKIPFKTLNELLDNTNFSITAIVNSSANKRIDKATSDINLKIKKRLAKYVESSKAGVEYVYTHGDAVFIDHDVQVCPHLRSNCSFAIIPGKSHYKHGFHLVFTKNHPLKNSFNTILGILQENGILEKITQTIKWDPKAYCKEQPVYNPISVDKIYNLILVMKIGIIMSGFAFILECCVSKCLRIKFKTIIKRRFY